MVVLLATTIISCSEAVGIINRLSNVVGLSQQQKTEVIKILREHIPTCPVVLEKNGKLQRK